MSGVRQSAKKPRLQRSFLGLLITYSLEMMATEDRRYDSKMMMSSERCRWKAGTFCKCSTRSLKDKVSQTLFQVGGCSLLLYCQTMTAEKIKYIRRQ